jgi:hypothetical protein
VSRPAPYQADIRAKGWRFELDLDRVRQSDTWALASPEVRPWLLMLWATAWEQQPCGSMPADPVLIAARIGMPAKQFEKAKAVLLRGWWLADDGRMYHPTIAELVLEMVRRKDAERNRKAAYRARMSRGTDTGQTQDSGGSDATGTGTGTGLRDTENSPHLAGAGAREGVEDLPDEQPPAAQPKAAGLVCRALRKAGIPDVNPGHPRLLALLQAGATEAEFMAFTPGACRASAPFLWLLAAVEGERKRAAANASAMHQGRMPQAAKPAWIAEREAREARNAEWAGPFAARKFQQQTKPLEVVIDADGKLLG